MKRHITQHIGRYRQALAGRVAPHYRIIKRTMQRTRAAFQRADVAIFHTLQPPPASGGHQFIRALWRAFEQQGLRVENNTISPATRACLYNSFNFDFDRLRWFARSGCRMVHRVDGPISGYRGWDNGTDRRIWQINRELAHATVFQSHYSLQQNQELGFVFAAPCVIMNAPDQDIFYARGRRPFDTQRKIRLISTSWSDNPNKGAATYQWLDEHLDWRQFEYTFIGRSPQTFQHIRMVGAMDSATLAATLRQHDIFITASRNDPCSNALLEALACGLPALYLQSGGHAEIVQQAGLGFSTAEEIPALLERLVNGYAHHQQQIRVPTIAETAGRYLQVLGMAP